MSNSQWGPRPEDQSGQQWGQQPGQQWQGQQTQPGWGPQPPAPRRGIGKTVAAIVSLPVLCLIAFAVTKASTQPPVVSASSTVSTNPGDVLATGPAKLAPKANRDAASAILRANTDHYRQVLTAGQSAWGTSKFGPWQVKTMMDLSYMPALSKADKNFTAADEPASITTWRDDAAAAGDAINQWAAKNALATSDKASMPSAKSVEQTFAKCDKDAADVAAGK
jgi:hypothetical protein